MKLPFKKVLLAGLISCLSLLGVQTSHSAIVRDDVNYQEFRDFAENKGRFVAGATNIEIKDKSGNSLGYVLNGVPMPDFSSVHRTRATSTLIHPQYVVSVAHNHKRNSPVNHWHYYIQFGDRGENNNPDSHHYNYAFVATNDDPNWKEQETRFNDYQIPRLNKLVTEVQPTIVSQSNKNTPLDYTNNQKYSAFARVGAGGQALMSSDGSTWNVDKPD